MNLKHLFTIARYTLLVAVVFGSAVIISSCDDDDGPSIYNGTVLDLIQDDKYKQAEGAAADVALDSLVKYLTIYPDLSASITAQLSGANEVTLFAPSNAAFITLLDTPGFPENIEDISPSLIVGVLGYHVLQGNYKKADITEADFGAAGIAGGYSDTNPCTGAQTPQVIKVNSDGTLLTGSTNNAIDIVKSNLLAENGTVHITEAVLIPPSVGASLTPILGKHAATVLLGADFSILARAMMKADCGVPGVTPISNILASTGPITVFLPPNQVFEGTAAAWPTGAITVDQLLAAFTPAQWRNILLNHIVAGSTANSALTNGAQLTTMQSAGAKLTVATGGTAGAPPLSPLGKYMSTSGGNAGLGGTTQIPIWAADVAGPTNGPFHVVGKIMIPN